jgi:hypothetical protein
VDVLEKLCRRGPGVSTASIFIIFTPDPKARCHVDTSTPPRRICNFDFANLVLRRQPALMPNDR